MKEKLLKNKTELICYIIAMLVTTTLATALSYAMAALIDKAVEGNVRVLLLTLASAGVIAISYLVLEYLTHLWKYAMVKSMNVRMRQNVFEKIFALKTCQYEERNSAEYINHLVSDCDMISDLYIDTVFNFIEGATQMLVVVIAVLITSVPMFCVMIIITIIAVIVSNLGGDKMEDAAQNYAQCRERYNTYVKERMTNYHLVRLYNLYTHEKKAHKEIVETMESALYTQKKIYAGKVISGETMGLGTTLLVMAAAAFMAINHMVSIGFVLVAGELVGRIIYPVTTIPQIVVSLKAAKPIFERLDGIVEADGGNEREGKSEVKEIKEICFKNVGFSYKGLKTPALEDINCRFVSGQKYLIVGESGCGKTTLLRLLSHTYVTTEGEVLLNTEDINQYSDESLYAKIGYMTQDVLLIEDSLRSNLSLYREFSDEKIYEALKSAGFTNPQTEFENGLDTMIAEDGKNFSGGQRQRMALARVLLHDFEWLVFDEFTSNLDSQIAEQMEDQILKLNKSVITVSHRLRKQAAEKYDQIIVMEKGHIVEMGTYGELMKRKGSFYKMIEK
ncbi:ABC-type multidrug transport system, ATPase and permease component [Lachnospiraceae bacterium XBB1006]|nr:ABC-type multidrug transport system, ATPase and permease component [Lachnospiraceae bacterium XBB1006]